MASALEPHLHLAVGHILFLDIVGYSKLLADEQKELVQELNRIVRETEQFREAEAEGKLTRLPTGDGMVLVFTNNPEAPVECALEISKTLQDYPQLKLRMGLHSGPVNPFADVNDQANLAGAGINIAQRVMSCGDAGHILLSKHFAEDLEHYRQWQPLLHDLGECEVKHGARAHVFNLYTEGIGNPELPEKLRRARLNRVPEKSIAVLPFENRSDEKQNEYFADGVQDEILNNLARIADLKVISRTSVIQYKSGTTRNLREIGQQLGVAHLLEGSVQRAANKIRVNAQLIDARTDTHLWGQIYDRDLADVFVIQSEIAKAIAEQLQAKLSPNEKAAIEKPPTTDLVAFDLYTRAKTLLLTVPSAVNPPQIVRQATELLNQAVARDPSFFEAYYELVFAHGVAYSMYGDHTPVRLALAEAALQAATRLRPDAGETHLARAYYVYSCLRDYNRALAELELARRTLPNDPRIFELTGFILHRRGQLEEGLRNLERAVELDPRNLSILTDLAASYMYLRRYPEMAAVLDRTLTIVPNDTPTRTFRASVDFFWKAEARPMHDLIDSILAKSPGAISNVANFWFACALSERDPTAAERALVALGDNPCYVNGPVILSRTFGEGLLARMVKDVPKAHAAFTKARLEQEKIVQARPDYGPPLCVLGLIDAALGRKEKALREGRRAIELLPVEKDSIQGSQLLVYFAIIAAWAAEKDIALQYLAANVQSPGGFVVSTYGALKLHPFWDPLRGDPRFEKIVASLAPKE